MHMENQALTNASLLLDLDDRHGHPGRPGRGSCAVMVVTVLVVVVVVVVEVVITIVVVVAVHVVALVIVVFVAFVHAYQLHSISVFWCTFLFFGGRNHKSSDINSDGCGWARSICHRCAS